MDLIGQKKYSQIQRPFKNYSSSSSSQSFLSQRNVLSGSSQGNSLSQASQTLKQRTSSLSEIGTPLYSYSKQLEETYSQILFEEIPCHHLFPVLERLCHTKDVNF